MVSRDCLAKKHVCVCDNWMAWLASYQLELASVHIVMLLPSSTVWISQSRSWLACIIRTFIRTVLAKVLACLILSSINLHTRQIPGIITGMNILCYRTCTLTKQLIIRHKLSCCCTFRHAQPNTCCSIPRYECSLPYYVKEGAYYSHNYALRYVNSILTATTELRNMDSFVIVVDSLSDTMHYFTYYGCIIYCHVICIQMHAWGTYKYFMNFVKEFLFVKSAQFLS